MVIFLSFYFLCQKFFVDKKADYAVKVSGVEISPNPVVSGQAATFKISATSGNLSLSLSLSPYLSGFAAFQISIKFYFICMVLLWSGDYRTFDTLKELI